MGLYFLKDFQPYIYLGGYDIIYVREESDKLDYQEKESLYKVLRRIDREKYYNWVLDKTYTDVNEGKLTSLDLSWLGIKELPSKFLEGLRDLKAIRLDNNPGCYYEDHSLYSAQLKKVRVQYCKLETFPSHAFGLGNEILKFDASHNQIGEFKRGHLSVLNRLRELDLTDTNLEMISKYTFKGLNRLQKLILNANHLKSIEDNVFSDLDHLKTLFIDNNEIKQLSEDAFGGLENLLELNMKINFIQTLPKGIFSDLKRLEGLSLFHNQIQNLEQQLKPLQSLVSLNLEMNYLNQLSKEMIKGLDNLVQLNVSSNQITNIEKGTFETLSELEFLNIEYNPLSLHSALNLPSYTKFDYSNHLKNLTPAKIHELILQYPNNENFIRQAKRNKQLLDKTLAFLRLQGD